MRRFFVLAAALRAAVVDALPWDGPVPTKAVDLDPGVWGWSPAPTAAPYGSELELFRRDAGRTCGYADGQVWNTVTCSPGYDCATNAALGVFGCCVKGDPCTIQTSCIPKTEASLCDSACQVNPRNIICTFSNALPYCGTYLFDLGSTSMTQVHCYASSFTTTVLLSATAGFSSSVGDAFFSGIVVASFASISDGNSVPSPESSGSGSAGASTSATYSMTDTGTAAAATSTSATPKPNGGGSSTNIGVIVGGAVGGAAVLGAVVFGIVFLVLRNKKKNAAAAAAADQPTAAGGMPPPGHPQYGNPPPMAPMPGQTAYDQTYAQQQQYPPPPGGYFAVPQDQKQPYAANQAVSPNSQGTGPWSPAPTTTPSEMGPGGHVDQQTTPDGRVIHEAPA